MERDALERFLRENGVPYDTWGATGSGGKTFLNLLRETQEDGVIIYKREDGKVARYAKRVFIHAEYVDLRTLTTYKLEEQARVFRDGSFETRILKTDDAFNQPSFTETMKPGEKAEDAALRGMSEELHLRGFPISRMQVLRYVSKKARPSRAYPGIDSVEHGYEVHCRLRYKDCRKKYIEYGDDGVVTISGWRGGLLPPQLLSR